MSRAKPNPTPEEISEGCRAVQQQWDRRERWKRSGKPRPRPWTVPIICAGEIMAAMCDGQWQGQEAEGAGQ